MGLLCSLLKRYNLNNCKNIEYLEQSLNTKTKICRLIIANVKINMDMDKLESSNSQIKLLVLGWGNMEKYGWVFPLNFIQHTIFL